MPVTQTPKRLATLAEAAAHAQVHRDTIRRRITAGDLTKYQLGARIVRVDLDELDALMKTEAAA